MQYLKYFFYLAWGWNFRIAFFIIYHEIIGEKKYRVHTLGINDLKSEINESALVHASVYQPINYYTAEKLFDQTYLEDISGSLIDMGCGKGRVFGIAAAYGFKHIIGVDFSETLCKQAINNANKLMQHHPDISIEVVCNDAATYDIPISVSTIFLFNPFDITIMRCMLRQLKKSIALKPRPIKILYANPVCKRLFIDAGFIETSYFQKLRYLEGCVLEMEP